jgi:hypothetical protein
MVSHEQLQLNLLATHGGMRCMPVNAYALKSIYICCVPLL